jgi:hypothetical protein
MGTHLNTPHGDAPELPLATLLQKMEKTVVPSSELQEEL